MKRKGFTLIELLAVIVILAIIALITVPVVINIINNSKKGAAEDSTYGVIESAKLFWVANQANFENTNPDILFTCNNGICTTTLSGSNQTTLDISGTKPTEGTIRINNGTISVTNLKFGDYYCSKVANIDKVSCLTSNNESENQNNNPITFNGTIIPAQNGDTHKGIMYLNPKDLSVECNLLNSQIGLGEPNESGCLKFYIYDDSNNEYKMILDHNTSDQIQWVNKDDFIESGGTESDWNSGEYNTRGAVTAKKQLAIDTADWLGNPRLISVDELANLVGINTSLTNWNKTKSYDNSPTDFSTQISWFYLDGSGNSYSQEDGWQYRNLPLTDISNYSWLYDYTKDCEYCETEGGLSTAYWTNDDTVGFNYRLAWHVNRYGAVDAESSSSTNGIRPVITFSKSLFE